MMLRKAVLLALGAVGGMAIVGGAVASTARQAREDKAAATAREAAPAATPAAAPTTTAVPTAQGPAAGKRALTKKGRPGAVRERYQKELRRAARGDWKEQEGPRGNNGFDAWFYGQRSFPAGRIPEGARVNAFRSAMQRNVGPRREAGEGGAAQADLPLPSWVPIGPSTIPDGQTDTGAGSVLSPVSGRLQDIAVHPTDPNIVYAGGAQGGVWKTTNALAASPTWTPLTDKQASLATGAIAIDPRSPNTVYVGTGEAAASCDSYYGAGILKTTDGGATWTLLGGAAGGPFRNYAISEIVVDPTPGSQTIWATTTLGFYSSGTSQCAAAPTTRNGGLWRSDDNGVTWTVQDVPTGAAAGVGAQIHDMVLSPDDATGNTLYVAVRSFPTAANGGVWKTTNAKASPATFTKVGNGFANTANANPGIRRITVGIGGAGSGRTLYAALGNTSSNLWGLYKTTDGGATWAHVDNGNNGTANVAGGSRTVVRVSGPSFTSLMVGRRIVINNTYSRTVSSVAGDGNSLAFSAGEATLSASTLAGATWSVGTYPRYCDGQCFYDMTVGVDPQDANVVYVGGNPQQFNDDKASLGASCTTSSACPAPLGVAHRRRRPHLEGRLAGRRRHRRPPRGRPRDRLRPQRVAQPRLQRQRRRHLALRRQGRELGLDEHEHRDHPVPERGPPPLEPRHRDRRDAGQRHEHPQPRPRGPPGLVPRGLRRRRTGDHRPVQPRADAAHVLQLGVPLHGPGQEHHRRGRRPGQLGVRGDLLRVRHLLLQRDGPHRPGVVLRARSPSTPPTRRTSCTSAATSSTARPTRSRRSASSRGRR